VSYTSILASVSHGSHVCAFYETEDDLLELVLPYVSAGLDRGDLCVWMTPEWISQDDARLRTGEAVLERGLELPPARGIYMRGGRFSRDRVVRFWDEKLQQALNANRSGLHVSGDAWWLQSDDWNAFTEYEADLNGMIADRPITCLCTYPMALSKIGDLFDMARAHQFVIAKRKLGWELVALPPADRNRHSEVQDAAARISKLTARERQVLDAIIDGRPNKVIAEELGINVRTVEAHRTRLLRRLGVRSMLEAVRLATLARFAADMPLSSVL
jgi:DNA-binding CsgD family transcriptional regulator